MKEPQKKKGLVLKEQITLKVTQDDKLLNDALKGQAGLDMPSHLRELVVNEIKRLAQIHLARTQNSEAQAS